MNRSTLNDTKLGDTNPRGRWRSPLLGRYARSMPSEREEKDQPLNFCRLRRQTALWYTLDKDQRTEREVRNCPPKRVRSTMESSGFDSHPEKVNHRPEASLACECGNALLEA